MSTGKNTPTPPSYAVDERDTEKAYGHDGGSWPSTDAPVAELDTSMSLDQPGGSDTWQPSGDANTVTEYDTSATNSQSYEVRPIETDTITELDTTIMSNAGTVYPKQPVYRPSLIGVPGSVQDTTRTDQQPGGSVEPLVPGTMDVSAQDVTLLGSTGHGGPPAGVAVPAKMAAPTVESGPYYVTVGWTAAADPEGDKVRGYTVISNTGGTVYAGRGDTSLKFQIVNADIDYTFQVFATSFAGDGPLSDPSEKVHAYNPNEPDTYAPGGIAPENVQNPVYRPDGSIMPGTGGVPLTPPETAPDAWAGTVDYVVGDKVSLTDGTVLECTTAGTSDVAEPATPAAVGDTVTDGTVVWTRES